MPMTTVSNLSGDDGRTFAIEAIGGTKQAGLRTSAYKLRVAYSSLAKTIHSIGQRGGKVVNVTMLTTPFSDLEDVPVASGVLIPFEETVAPQPAEKATSKPQPESRRQHSKSKKR